MTPLAASRSRGTPWRRRSAAQGRHCCSAQGRASQPPTATSAARSDGRTCSKTRSERLKSVSVQTSIPSQRTEHHRQLFRGSEEELLVWRHISYASRLYLLPAAESVLHSCVCGTHFVLLEGCLLPCSDQYESSSHLIACFKVMAKSSTIATRTAEPRRVKTTQNS
jgi:hypothetical protein